MDTIEIHHYSLTPKKALNAKVTALPRHGIIIKAYGGYCSLQPWPELGDLPLDEQLTLLRQGKTSSLIERSLYYCALDGKARMEKISLLAGKQIPKSHRTFLDWSEVASAVKHPAVIKTKVGRNPEHEASLLSSLQLHPEARLRLDANFSFTKETFESFLLLLSDSVLAQIEFFEDPIPYNSMQWSLYESSGIRLALDRHESVMTEGGYSYRVIKPISQNISEILAFEMQSNTKICITSSMDHPLGVAIAAYEATIVKELYPHMLIECGLLTNDLFTPSPFSEVMKSCDDGGIQLSPGFGFGFDDLLRSLSWSTL